MKIDEIQWNDETAFLVRDPNASEDEIIADLERRGYDPEAFEVGPVQRFRKRPCSTGEFDTWIDACSGPNMRGTFEARLVR